MRLSTAVTPGAAHAARGRQAMARSTRRAISDLECTPMMRSTSRPRLKTSSIGMLRTLRRLAVMGLSSMFSFANACAAGQLRRELIDHGRDHPARPTPWCPGVQQHRQRRALHFGRERRVAYGHGHCRSGGPHNLPQFDKAFRGRLRTSPRTFCARYCSR